MHYEMYRDVNNEWRWRLKARNGKIVAISGEGYRYRGGCTYNLRLVQRSGVVPVHVLSAPEWHSPI